MNLDEYTEETVRLLSETGEPFSPHDVALHMMDTACAQGLVTSEAEIDLGMMQVEEKARGLMGLGG